jgi:hypothetical protein
LRDRQNKNPGRSRGCFLTSFHFAHSAKDSPLVQFQKSFLSFLFGYIFQGGEQLFYCHRLAFLEASAKQYQVCHKLIAKFRLGNILGFYPQTSTSARSILTLDVGDIATHEFGHWIGLDDLYQSADQDLTMYGYGFMTELKKDTLGMGDILGAATITP